MTEVLVPFAPHTVRHIVGFMELEEISLVVTRTSQVPVETKQ